MGSRVEFRTTCSDGSCTSVRKTAAVPVAKATAADSKICFAGPDGRIVIERPAGMHDSEWLGKIKKIREAEARFGIAQSRYVVAKGHATAAQLDDELTRVEKALAPASHAPTGQHYGAADQRGRHEGSVAEGRLAAARAEIGTPVHIRARMTVESAKERLAALQAQLRGL